jgi:hypothetical protein
VHYFLRGLDVDQQFDFLIKSDFELLSNLIRVRVFRSKREGHQIISPFEHFHLIYDFESRYLSSKF